MMILPIEWCFSTESRGILSELHRLNPDIQVIAPIKNGALNRDLITTIVDLLARYQDLNGGAVDGVLFDDDADEQSIFYLWQKEYAKAIRDRFGDDFIQVGNGGPPQEETVLAHYLNGIFYELYPNNPWGEPTALDCCDFSRTSRTDT